VYNKNVIKGKEGRIVDYGKFNISEKTQMFSINNEKQEEIRKSLQTVYNSLKEKGYNPINQIVGYILSEDPTYITNYNNARVLIRKIDRDELLKALVQNYLDL
jgi:uncharacterized protein (UPF0297 family)